MTQMRAEQTPRNGSEVHQQEWCVECYANSSTFTKATKHFFKDPVCQPCYKRLCKDMGISEDQGLSHAPSPAVTSSISPATPQPPASPAAKPQPSVAHSKGAETASSAPAQTQERETMVLSEAERAQRKKCPGGCGRTLRKDNTTGICGPCGKKGKGTQSGGSPDVPISRSPDQVVTVQVKPFQLDRWWNALPVEDKADVFSQYMQREA